MNDRVNRRNFLKAAGTTAGFAIAAGYSPLSYAQNENVRVGCIGTGGQGTFHIRDGLTGTPEIAIIAVCDVFEPHQKEAAKYAQVSNAGVYVTPDKKFTDEERKVIMSLRRPKAYYDYKEMLEKEELDAVVIATPLTTHFPITMDCLDAGKYVFCETTLVDNIADGRALIKKCGDLNRWVQVGHQRRYHPKYNAAMGLAYDNGMLGRITHITAQWHRNHYWRRVIPDDYKLNDIERKYISDLEKHLNWRLYKETSGGLFTEHAVLQADVANWFLKQVPSRVNTSGSLDYWRDGRTIEDNIACIYEYDQEPGNPGFIPIDARSMHQKLNQINRSYKVRFVYSTILTNAKQGISEIIQGDRGSFELTEHKKCRLFREDVVEQRNPRDMSRTCSSRTIHPTNPPSYLLLDDTVLETPDVYQFRGFVDCIKNGGVPRNNQMVGFTAAVTVIAAIQSSNEGHPVEIAPALYTFDFPVPSFYEYEPWNEENQGTLLTPEPQPEES